MARQPKAFLACYLILVRGGRILLSKRANTGFQDGKYSMVAGHLEGSESIWEAVMREAKEESGLEPDEKGLRLVHVMHRHDVDREYVDFFIQSDVVGEPRNLEPEKCAGLEWFGLDRIPDETIPYVRAAIENIKAGRFFAEYRV